MHPCKPQRLGEKHLRIIEKQTGLRKEEWPNTLNVQGVWYLITQPEHLEAPVLTRHESDWLMLATGRADVPWHFCPMCGGAVLDAPPHGWAMEPIPCVHCSRVGWIYDEFMDTWKNEDLYASDIARLGNILPEIAFDRYGIPKEFYDVV